VGADARRRVHKQVCVEADAAAFTDEAHADLAFLTFPIGRTQIHIERDADRGEAGPHGLTAAI
jgi:hypothetical protein